MDIPAYQIHKIINVYSRQLSQSKLHYQKSKILKKSYTVKRIAISSKGKRQIINRVADEIVSRITNLGLSDETDSRCDDNVECARGEEPKKIEAGNKETISKMPLADPDRLISSPDGEN